MENTTQEQKQETLEENTESTSRSFPWAVVFIVISLVIALGALASAAYIWQQFEQYKVAENRANQSLEVDIANKLNSADLNTKILFEVNPLKSKVAQIEKTAEQHNKQVKQQYETLSDSTKKLFELYGRDKNGWQLAEVEYLLRVAQHRLVIENDFQGAEHTLKAADVKITEIADPGLLPVRVAISNERVLLQTRTRPDLVGTVLSLSRIIKQIPQLKISVESEPVVHHPSAPQEFSFDGDWQLQAEQFIKGLVTVQPLKTSIKAENTTVVDVLQTLEEYLNLAKWAVLDRNQKQYHALMQKSVTLFAQYIDPKNNYHKEIDAELKRLSGVMIKPELPDISESMLLLKQVMIRKEHKLKQVQVEAEAARQAAREEAEEAARQAAREEAEEAARQAAKEKAEEAARQAAREKAEEAARQAAKEKAEKQKIAEQAIEAKRAVEEEKRLQQIADEHKQQIEKELIAQEVQADKQEGENNE